MVVMFLSLYWVGGINLLPVKSVADFVRRYDFFEYAHFPALILQIYLAHWAAWKLAQLYRARHALFGWVLQEHVYKNRTRRPLKRRIRASQPQIPLATPNNRTPPARHVR
jgi:hypothetical protein